MNKRNQTHIVKRILNYIIPYKAEVVVILICLMVTAVMTFLQPLFIQQITDKGMMDRNMPCILKFAGLIFAAGLISQIMEFVQNNYFISIHNKFSMALNKAAFTKMYRLPISYFSEKGGAEIVNTLGADIGNLLLITESVSALSISSLLQIIGGLIGLLILDWRLTFAIIILIPIKVLLTVWFSKRKNKLFDGFLEENRKYYSWVDDQISGIREMKLRNLFYIQSEKFYKLQKKIMDSYKDNSVWDQKKVFCEDILDVTLKCLLYILSGYLIMRRHMTIGSAFAFITYSAYVTVPVTALINIRYLFASVGPSAVRFFNFLDLPEEKYLAVKDVKKTTREDIIIEFDRVSFSYEEKRPILENVDFKVQRGEKVGIIGENGSGKSTVLDLLLGLYQPRSGVIKIEGVPMSELGLETVRGKIAIVSQRPYLYNATVEENVNLKGDASTEKIRKACEISGADTFINHLELGYQQSLGRDGAKLSGGERQKIAVARAILKDADILLMDEATVGYDIGSNQNMSVLFQKEFKEKTVIMVTHNYEELLMVDYVYEIKNGRLNKIKGRFIDKK